MKQFAFRPFAATETEELIETIVQTVAEYNLTVFNDDVNTFDHVLETLIDVCGHERQQAEQCALLIHYRGKCSVKQGEFDTLAPMRQAICDRGISAEIV